MKQFAVILLLALSCAAEPLPQRAGYEKLRDRCERNKLDEANALLIRPNNRSSVVYFVEGNIYETYVLEVSGNTLTGFVGPEKLRFVGELIQNRPGKEHLIIKDSPGAKLDGAVIYYSNDEYEKLNDQEILPSYVASINCIDSKIGGLSFEIRKPLSVDELERIEHYYGVQMDSRLIETLRM